MRIEIDPQSKADWRAGLIVFLCAYEITAIVLGHSRRPRIPTITAICHDARSHRIARLGLWLTLGWLIEHLFGEGREALGQENSHCGCTTVS